MYNEIINAAQAIAQEMEALHNRTVRLESELNKEKLKKEQFKHDIFSALESYFQED